MKERVGVVSRTVHWNVTEASKDGIGNAVPGMPPVRHDVVNFRLVGSGPTVWMIEAFIMGELPLVGAFSSTWLLGTREKLAKAVIDSQLEKSPSNV